MVNVWVRECLVYAGYIRLDSQPCANREMHPDGSSGITLDNSFHRVLHCIFHSRPGNSQLPQVRQGVGESPVGA